MPDITPRNCAPVSAGTGLSPARSLAKSHFLKMGTRQPAQSEILLIINELASNIIRHGGRGEICIYPVTLGIHAGYLIRATDSGPGINDVGQALEPGISSDGGLGLGLNAVKNISDDLRISSGISGGTVIEVWKWVR